VLQIDQSGSPVIIRSQPVHVTPTVHAYALSHNDYFDPSATYTLDGYRAQITALDREERMVCARPRAAGDSAIWPSRTGSAGLDNQCVWLYARCKSAL
jgi:hypothetical protein